MNQTWKHLDTKTVQDFVEASDKWRQALEGRTHQNLVDGTWKIKWLRARNPSAGMKRVTWLQHVDAVIAECGKTWNTAKKDGDEVFVPTFENFLKGPPISNKLEADADLLNLPIPTPISSKHLYGYVADLRGKIAQAQLTKHITNERAFRYAVATTWEALQRWEAAADELEHVANIEMALKEYVYMVRVLLRKGIALYNAKQFKDAVDTFKRAIRIIDNDLPEEAALRTEVRIWDYLGLCYIKLNQPQKGLEIFFDKRHIIRAKKIGTPLGDASRNVRIGIAYLDLKNFDGAKASFIQGVKLRLTVGAFAEAVVALRYLGLLYFRTDKYLKALTIWNLCLEVQRGIQNQNEIIKLEFFRARLFAKLWEISEENPEQISFPIVCNITEELFSDKEEREALLSIAKRFRDLRKTYRRTQLLRIAHAVYNHCIEIAEAKSDEKWASEARECLSTLPPAYAL